jgi:NAD-dependent dihydropyrimidine dehydrogenase PreA subunit
LRVTIRVGPSCNLCRICEEYCPVGVFEIVGRSLHVRQELCIYCKGCEVLCPVKAIEVVALDEDLEISRVTALRGSGFSSHIDS